MEKHNHFYYDSENAKVEILFEHDSDEEDSYGFRIFALFKDKDGKVYWGTDSGCSCRSPFEDCDNLGELSQVNQNTIGQLRDDWSCHFMMADNGMRGAPKDEAEIQLLKALDSVGLLYLWQEEEYSFNEKD